MKLGLGLYKHMLTPDNFAFARQCGATHLVIHLVDYFYKGSHSPNENQPTGGSDGWGLCPSRPLWTEDELGAIKAQAAEAGLEIAAIENLDPAHWHDILLDGHKRDTQIADIKTLIRRIGRVGIPVVGYNFSLAGVTGRITGPFARGGASSVGMNGSFDEPIPKGMVWNMTYDPNAPKETLPSITSNELWDRVTRFLNELLPVAEQAGVALAAHPDDPPLPTLRQQPRLVYQPNLYDRLIGINASPANQLELCLGTMAEMTDGDLYESLDAYTKSNRVAYIHLRNVTGKVPHYRETFIDDGDIDMARVVHILKKNDFQGVIIPDHTPQITCQAPWHAGMAHALGYIRGLISN